MLIMTIDKRKRVYISADYSENDGDRSVVEILHAWGNDDLHKVSFVDTACVVSGSVSQDSDCRACDLKAEFNSQIDVSSSVIFIIGDKTSSRTAGSLCRRITEGAFCQCTPYKQNVNGCSVCKIYGQTYVPAPNEDVGKINSYSYLEHEFKQAERKNKNIIVVYNSLYKQPNWLPSYMRDYADIAQPFWVKSSTGEKIGNYDFIKRALLENE